MLPEYLSKGAVVLIPDAIRDFIKRERLGLEQMFGRFNPDPLQINQRCIPGGPFEPALECPPAHPESARQFLIRIVLIKKIGRASCRERV